jgi:putative ubiquitin-RnfH superfamily antitoxin RatB of RatAB toxin-antitoxin module
VLQEGDRVELYRPLAVDPKAARRARATENQTAKARNPLTAKPQRRG